MVLKYVIGKAPTVMEDLLVRITEAQNDDPVNAFVYEEVLPEDGGGGHPNEHVVTANGLDKVVHIVYLFGVTSGTQYERYTAEPKEPIVTIFAPIRFKIGDGGPLTPAAGTNTYTNPLLIGLDETEDFVIIRNNVGALLPGIAFSFNPVTGTVQLPGDDTFGEPIPGQGEEWTIMLQPSVIETVVNDSVVGKDFGGFVDIVVDTDYDNATHLRKLLRFSGNANFTFPADSNPPIGYPMRFQKFGAAAGTSRINFLNAPLQWTSGDKTFIDLPDYSEASFVFDGVQWNVVWLNQSSWINGQTGPTAGQNVGAGVLFIGDVPAGDPSYTVTHNLNISGDYMVLLSVKSNTQAASFSNNKIGMAWWHMEDGTKKDRFRFTLQEISGETQNCSIAWLIVKL